jgi:leader peptidase (prepilin peptidase) / N-methyltransferase
LRIPPIGVRMVRNPASQLLARCRAAIWSAVGDIRTPQTLAFATVGVCGIVASLILSFDARGVAGAGLAALMFAIAAVDARRFIIPDEFTASALVLGFVYAAIEDMDAIVQAIALSVLRGAVLALAFLVLRVGYRRFRGRDGIGLGDVKLMAVAGVWLSWTTIPIAIEIAAVAALGTYMARHLFFSRTVRATTRLPFGLFLAPAIWIGWLVEEALNQYASASSF